MFCTSCAQLNEFQSAKTVGKGQTSICATLSAYGLTENDVNNSLGTIVLPFATARVTHGIAEKVDFSASLSSGGNILVTPKYQFLGKSSSPWVGSVEPGASVQFGQGLSETIMRFRLGGSFSHYSDPQRSFTISPLHIVQVEFQEANEVHHFTGLTLSFQRPLRENLQLGFGASFFKPYEDDIRDDGLLFNVGGGVQYFLSR